MTPTDRVMLFIDADNVSADVISQAIAKVKADHGAIHVRRAHCTPEAALKHAKLFKSLSIRPIVNLASGKNSTDIALAVDAMDLVCSERPQLVIIVSSDSDFAPLVIRLREKGCRVCGIGQQGKTGDEVVEVYDEFIDLPHRKSPPNNPPMKTSPAPRSRGRRPARGGNERMDNDRAPERTPRPAAGRLPERAVQHGDEQTGLFTEPLPMDPGPERFDDAPSGRRRGRGSSRSKDRGADRPMGDRPPQRNERHADRAPAASSASAEWATDAPVESADAWVPFVDETDRRDDDPPITPVDLREANAPAEPPPAAALEPDPEEVEPVIEPAAKRASKRRPRGSKAAAAAPVEAADDVDTAAPPAPQPKQAPTPAPVTATAPKAPALLQPPAPPAAVPLSDSALARLRSADIPEEVQRVIETIPELFGGGVFELSHAAERLRASGLLAKNAPSTKLFRKFPDLFVLTPGRQPNKVRFSGTLPE